MVDEIVPTDPVKSEALKDAVKSEVSLADTKAVMASIESKPTLINDLSLEPWYQSGVGFFSVGGVGFATIVILNQLVNHGIDLPGYDWGLVTNQISVLALFGGVLYRRFVPGLKPLFHRWLR